MKLGGKLVSLKFTFSMYKGCLYKCYVLMIAIFKQGRLRSITAEDLKGSERI